jgi:hypothetical protein
MLEHEQSPPKAEAVVAMDVDTRVAAYLDTLCAPLAETLAEEQRRAYRAEMEEHLEAMIEAHQELGATREEAVARALKQFGNAQRVASVWEQTVESPRPVSLRQALRTPFRCFGGMMLLWIALFFLCVLYPIHFPQPWMDIAILIWMIGMPMAAGIGTGWTTRGRPILGTLLTLPMLHLALALVYWFMVPIDSHPGAMKSVWLQLISWSVTGASAAGLAYRMKRLFRRRSRVAL